MATIRSDSKFFYFFKSNVVFILKSSSIKDYGKLEICAAFIHKFCCIHFSQANLSASVHLKF